MPFAGAEETGFNSSDISLRHPHIKKTATYSASFPFIKPEFSAKPQQDFVQIIKHLGRVCCKRLKIPAIETVEQKDDFSLGESKYIIRELAGELDRVVQFKVSLMTEKNIKNKETKEQQEEQEYYIFQWAEDLIQTKQTDKEEEQQLLSESLTNSKTSFKQAKKVLSDWSWILKDKQQNSVCPKGENEEILKDLFRQWKHKESSMLPVMDWMIWTVLQSDKGSQQDSIARQWIRNKQKSEKTAGLRIPKPVWKSITKSTANVFLDPNTANPELLISEDGKYLRSREYTGQDNWEGFERKRSKFDGWTCVQAKQGYHTGRHYWEVDVKKKHEWRVGVVKESAARKGFVTMNPKAGYWSLRLQMGTVIALTEPVTKLNLQSPSKIGVYLDIEEEHVSFYDAEKRRHIYTFNANFNKTEKIYPMFGTFETDRALVIST